MNKTSSGKNHHWFPLRLFVHVYAWSALALLSFNWIAGNLSANPIQDLEQGTGRHAITLLTLALLCTPLHTLFKWKDALKQRRTLGLYAFLYACIHMLIFIDLDFGLAWHSIIQEVIEKNYLLAGMVAFFLMLPLAITSFDIWKIRLGRNWKRLHQFIYWIAPIATLHYLWSKKGNAFSLQGDIIRPMFYGLVIAILLLMRIPPIRKKLSGLGNQMQLFL